MRSSDFYTTLDAEFRRFIQAGSILCLIRSIKIHYNQIPSHKKKNREKRTGKSRIKIERIQ